MTATTSPDPAGSTVERPTSVDEAVKVLRDSRGSVLFRGAGTKMSWAGRPEDPIRNFNSAMEWSSSEHPLYAYLFWGAEYWVLRDRSGDSSYLQAFTRILGEA